MNIITGSALLLILGTVFNHESLFFMINEDTTIQHDLKGRVVVLVVKPDCTHIASFVIGSFVYEAHGLKITNSTITAKFRYLNIYTIYVDDKLIYTIFSNTANLVDTNNIRIKNLNDNLYKISSMNTTFYADYKYGCSCNKTINRN